MKKNVILLFALFVLTFIGCNKDDETIAIPVAVAFANQSINLSTSQSEVIIAFSTPTTAAGTITLNVVPTNLVYGTDFTTAPEVVNNTITVPFLANATTAKITFNKLVDAIEGQVKNLKITIGAVSLANVQLPVTTNFTQLNFNEKPMLTNTMVVTNGGNTFPKQVYIDLSSGISTGVARTSWDLGFDSGADFRVVLNSAVNNFAVKQLATNNIDEVQAEDAKVTTGNFDPTGVAYIDNPSGNLNKTAIAEVATADADNKVYLVNLGQEVATEPVSGTGASLAGAARGWKKIRILKSGNDYKLQYADINATTHSEITIAKNAAYNFSFFSFVTKTVVLAEPIKEKWDINIAPFMNLTPNGSGVDVSYYFSDVAITNTKAGTRAYEVLSSSFTYNDFALSNVVADNFELDAAKDKRAIGSKWRSTFSVTVKSDRFYVIKDPAGNLYKLKFTSMLSTASERGTITFDYKKL